MAEGGGEKERGQDFWTFLPQNLRLIGHRAVVDGWFIFCRMTPALVDEQLGVTEGGLHFSYDYLTDASEPVTLDISGFLSAGSGPLDLTPRAVLLALERLLRLPFHQVPAPPTDLKLHRLPPSQRRKLEEARRLLDNAAVISRKSYARPGN